MVFFFFFFIISLFLLLFVAVKLFGWIYLPAPSLEVDLQTVTTH